MTGQPTFNCITSKADRPCLRNEGGNVLFYILIAVALLASLSFAVSNSSRNSTSILTQEQARLITSEILEYSSIVSSAVAQLRLRGCEISELSFENDQIAGYENAGAPGDFSCHIFQINGGGIEYRRPEEEWRDESNSAQANYNELFFPRDTCVIEVGTTSTPFNSRCDDNGDEELLLAYPWIKREICIAINERVGMDNPGGEPPLNTGLAWSQRFTGTLSGSLEIGNGPNDPAFRGRTVGCFEGSSSQAGGYHFYKVLIAQ